MSAFILSPAAAQDLNELWEFIAADSVDAADRVCEEIYRAIQRLADMPEIGHSRADLTDKPVRFWRVRSYLIIYRPDTVPVEVVRVLHGARDAAALL
ncbi:MAG: type II toxin-antitoxin system RelE/ParE family toxin [Acidobacteria bacterium]|nr:type II toxin-antitoxin system RelE/ParE family toxin [Acidobacteriota bacterium]